MKNRKLILFFILFGFTFSQESSNIYWNSLSTELIIKVPIIEDNSLENGQVQISASFNGGKSFKNLGKPVKIENNDIDNIKDVSIDGNIFESMDGFKEGANVQFKTEIWDRVGNNTAGEVSDSILIIDETPPEIIKLIVLSSNSISPQIANPKDSITFTFDVNEPIITPTLLINNESYMAMSSSSTSWSFNYKPEHNKDGIIEFEIYYEDFAENPGSLVKKPSNGEDIFFDGTLPELTNVKLFTSNNFDKLMAKEADSIFLQFKASEDIQNINVRLSGNEAIQKFSEGLIFNYYYIFSKTDSNGVVPFTINYEDMAGNEGKLVKETSDGSFITLDTNPPEGIKVQTIGANFKGGSKKKLKTTSKLSKSSKKTNSDIFGIPFFYFLITSSIFGLLFLIRWVSFFKIFSKADESGWKALIPFYSTFIWIKILKKPIWWLAIYLIFPPIGYLVIAWDTSKLFGKKIIFTLGLILLPFIFYPMVAFGKSKVGDKPILKKVSKKKVMKKK